MLKAIASRLYSNIPSYSLDGLIYVLTKKMFRCITSSQKVVIEIEPGKELVCKYIANRTFDQIDFLARHARIYLSHM